MAPVIVPADPRLSHDIRKAHGSVPHSQTLTVKIDVLAQDMRLDNHGAAFIYHKASQSWHPRCSPSTNQCVPIMSETGHFELGQGQRTHGEQSTVTFSIARARDVPLSERLRLSICGFWAAPVSAGRADAASGPRSREARRSGGLALP